MQISETILVGMSGVYDGKKALSGLYLNIPRTSKVAATYPLRKPRRGAWGVVQVRGWGKTEQHIISILPSAMMVIPFYTLADRYPFVNIEGTAQRVEWIGLCRLLRNGRGLRLYLPRKVFLTLGGKFEKGQTAALSVLYDKQLFFLARLT